MMKFPVTQMPEGFHVNDGVVIYDVTPQTFGTWTGVEVRDGNLMLFPQRSYRHKDLARRLGLPDAD